MREARSFKAAHSIHKVFYFAFATIWGYVVMKDEEYLPPLLGGTGSYTLACQDKWIKYPQHTAGMKEYILVTSGFHVAGFVVHFMDSKKNDFVEMALHHIVALYLFGGLYLFNVWEAGSVIAFLHDIADIFVSLSKSWAETNYSNVTAVLFVCAMGIWFYTRIFSLPILMYKLAETEFPIGNYCKYIFLYLLSCMLTLHVYWFTLFCKILMKFVKSGEAED